jgi:hypothetical protein
MSAKPTLKSLDARLRVVEVEVAGVKKDVLAGNDTLDKLFQLVQEQGKTQRTRMTSRTRIITALLTAIGTTTGAIAAIIASGCS